MIGSNIRSRIAYEMNIIIIRWTGEVAKRHNQANIIIFISAPDMSIIYEHVHRLELHQLFKFCVEHLSGKIEIRTISNFPTCMSKITKYRITDKQGFRYICYIYTATHEFLTQFQFMDMFIYYGHFW